MFPLFFSSYLNQIVSFFETHTYISTMVYATMYFLLNNSSDDSQDGKTGERNVTDFTYKRSS